MVEESEKKVCWSGPGVALPKKVGDDGSRLLIDRMNLSDECAPLGEKEWYREKLCFPSLCRSAREWKAFCFFINVKEILR